MMGCNVLTCRGAKPPLMTLDWLYWMIWFRVSKCWFPRVKIIQPGW
jgi:hypothetical protein